jgi:hypothetical protein
MEEWLNMLNEKMKKKNRNAILFLDNAAYHPKGNTFKCENQPVPSKHNKCITAHGYGCYLHIQIALQTISDAIFDFECRRSRYLLRISRICIGCGCCELDRKKGDLLCGLVVRVLGYRSGGPGSIPSTTRKKKVVGLEWGPLNLVSTTEELLDRKVAAPV